VATKPRRHVPSSLLRLKTLQVMEPHCLSALSRAEMFVLVGDHNQLPPLVISKEAASMGMSDSLFKRLSDAHPAAIVTLTKQYRMNFDIM
jgi:DNA replication ATP-dependent helicase Dna2